MTDRLVSFAGIIPLAAAHRPDCGGKANGLASLIEHGLRVPWGFVIVGSHTAPDPAAIEALHATLGPGKLAVRSSAAGEDSQATSYAGQYESVLEVEGHSALVAAIERCLASAKAARVQAYAAATASDVDPGMTVIVQQMVDARCAGVLFTRDPVSGDRSRYVIEAVAGLGEALVSGHARPDRYLIDPDSARVESELSGPTALLDADALTQLLAGARRARARFGHDLDLEWAIDRYGALHWLQARPITSAAAPAVNELDTPILLPSPGFTRYNVGEILPGAITPLTASTVVAFIDQGFRQAYARIGVYAPPDTDDASIVVFSGHLFFNMRGPYLFAAKVAGASKDEADRSLAGRVFDELEGLPRRGPLRRARTAACVFPALARAPELLAELEPQLAALHDSHAGLAELGVDELLTRVEALIACGVRLNEAHMLASTRSGMLAGVVDGIVGGGRPLDPEQRTAIIGLLQGVGEVESAEIGVAVQALATLLRADPATRARVLELDSAQLHAWLRSDEAGQAGQLYADFIARHGHRCIRELELREPDWADDPTALLVTLRAAVSAPPPRARVQPRDPDTLPLSRGSKRALRWLVPKMHASIRLREQGKSRLVRLTRLLASTCVELGNRLVAAQRLPELDLIYFVTRDELPRLAHAPDDQRRALVLTATGRRRLHARQAALRFAMVSREKPQPLPPAPLPDATQRLQGTPVSPGLVEGRARVIRSIQDAAGLVPGEILIVPFTDAGWTPLFTIAAGLATEIGGTLSHGAVVARELGLPAVVDLPDATRIFTTGQRVRLNADAGTLEALDQDDGGIA
ncbi:PEP/pyruvate-binding domain-containing protein [Enhygromyxa salina]|uniref:Chondramide synthase cmdD n=1 Tax=Enhygromyxa salina TaxID=215803 RepID=A0A2S9YJ81_9BACT|nr:PEP/pyruvate-binding domain-containing protein [Enhygromyxa salina]PRQ05163.1 Chondramide synthase cmdD [Enhygromyxa salina]